MELDTAVLSSLSSSLGDLVERITALAEGLGQSPREDVAGDLYEIERQLAGAHRRLQALVQRL